MNQTIFTEKSIGKVWEVTAIKMAPKKQPNKMSKWKKNDRRKFKFRLTNIPLNWLVKRCQILEFEQNFFPLVTGIDGINWSNILLDIHTSKHTRIDTIKFKFGRAFFKRLFFNNKIGRCFSSDSHSKLV